MKDHINNIICALVVSAVFAMIGDVIRRALERLQELEGQK